VCASGVEVGGFQVKRRSWNRQKDYLHVCKSYQLMIFKSYVIGSIGHIPKVPHTECVAILIPSIQFKCFPSLYSSIKA